MPWKPVQDFQMRHLCRLFYLFIVKLSICGIVACHCSTSYSLHRFSEIIVLLLAKNQQMQEAFSQPHLGAFFAPQKTGLSGGFVYPSVEFCNAAILQSPEAH
jgi:hypothetical protein